MSAMLEKNATVCTTSYHKKRARNATVCNKIPAGGESANHEQNYSDSDESESQSLKCVYLFKPPQ